MTLGPRPTREHGQAAVEVALVLPLLAVLALALVQVTLIVRDQLLVTHGARAGARQAAVSADPASVRAAVLGSSTGLIDDRVTVTVVGRAAEGSQVEVRVRYRAPTDVPVVGALVGDVTLEDTVTMRVEVAAPPPPNRGD